MELPRISMAKIQWQDGDIPYSTDFNDVYFSHAGGVRESEHVYLQGNHLPQRFATAINSFTIGEIGFGTGLNFLLTCREFLKTAPSHTTLFYFSCEMRPLTADDLKRAHRAWPELAELSQSLQSDYDWLTPGLHSFHFFQKRIRLFLLLGEASQTLKQWVTPAQAWYLDGFSPSQNPEAWHKDLFQQVARLSTPETTATSFSVAGSVRRALQDVGFVLQKPPGFGTKREMLFAQMKTSAASTPLSPLEPWYRPPAPFKHLVKAIVIGAGLAGSALVKSLTSRGISVQWIEKHAKTAEKTSGNPAGIFMPQLSASRNFISRLSQIHFAHFVREVKKSHPTACTGALELIHSEAEKTRLETAVELAEFPAGFAEFLDSKEASERAGVVLQCAALSLRDAGWISPRALCDSRVQGISPLLLQKNFSSTALQLKPIVDGWAVFDATGKLIGEAPVVFLATGQDYLQFEQTHWLQAKSVRGQIFTLEQKALKKIPKVPLCYEGYITPADDKKVLIGATYSSKKNDPNPLLEDRHFLLSECQRVLPDLFFEQPPDKISTLALDGIDRVSFRVSAPDKIPLVGPLPIEMAWREQYADLARGYPNSSYSPAPCYPGLYVSLAHGSRGIVTSQLCAELIVAQMLGEPLPLEADLIEVLHPGRSLIREMRRTAPNSPLRSR